MATIVTEDGCQNDITVASEPPQQPKTVDLRPSATSVASSAIAANEPTLRSQESISVRRDRSITAFLFEEIAGKKLKCYEQWKLWVVLFVCMTFIAVLAITVAGYYAVKVNAYESKSDAASAESTLIYDIVHHETANISDSGHIDEAQKIFNSFDDDADGVWNSDEFHDYFVLASSAQLMFDSIDANGDDILSWTEIRSSIWKYSLSQSYIPSVRAMYNYTFANASDPLLHNYAANVFLDYYNIDEFGFITRAYYYAFHSNISFQSSDRNKDHVINFEEFSRKIANDEMIAFLREWDLESYLSSLNRTGTGSDTHVYDIPNVAMADMCPSNQRRRLVDADDVRFDRGGLLFYEFQHEECTAKLTCENDIDGYYTDESIDWNCNEEQVEYTVACMVTVIEMYFDGEPIVQCQKEMYDCLDEGWRIFSGDCEDIHCWCSCSEGCHIDQIWKEDNRRRLGSSCGKDKCACGGGCTCFSGDNEMWIKRDDIIQNVLLKELKIGDYAQTKEGEWSKVWFIKEEESSEYEFLKLYFADDAYITMTNHHLLYVGDRTEQSMKRADQVTIGDIVFVSMQNATVLVQKEIVAIESTISADGAYAPVTMEGSIVVSNVLASCYVESPQKAQRLHDTAAIFRWISGFHTNLASAMCHFFYDNFFLKLRNDYGLDAAHIVFNAYSMPCIVVATVNIAIVGFIRSFSR